MRKYIWLLIAALASVHLTPLIGQSDAGQKLKEIQKILNALDVNKVSVELSQPLTGQMDSILVEVRKIRSVILPPHVPPQWQRSFQNNIWQAQAPQGITLQYAPSSTMLQSGYWTQTVTIADFDTFCRMNKLNIGSFTSFRGKGSVKNVSFEGKSRYCSWLAGRSLTMLEKRFLKELQKDGLFLAYIPDFSKNSFYQIQKGKLTVKATNWKSWDQEHAALNQAINYWKISLNFAAMREKKQVENWLAGIKNRRQVLEAEKKLYAQIIAVVEQESKTKPKTIRQTLANVDRLLSLARDYGGKYKSGQVSGHYGSKVTAFQTQWGQTRTNLEKMKTLASQIEKEVMQINQSSSKLKPEDLQYRLKQAYKLVESYQNLIQTNKLQSYEDPKIRSLSGDIAKRLEYAELENNMNKISKVYQAWKSQQNKEGIDQELKALEDFLSKYQQYKNMASGNHVYAERLQRWKQEAQERKVVLNSEKNYFDKISQLVNALSMEKDLQKSLTLLNQGIENCQKYRKMAGERKISGYHQKKIEDHLKNMTKERDVIQRELKIYQQLQKAYNNYVSTNYTKLSEEKELLNTILTLTKNYDRHLKYKEVKGNHQKQIGEWQKQTQARINLVVSEENSFTGLEISIKKWKKQTSWNNLKSEQNTLNKLHESCQDYQNKLKMREITGYHRNQVQQWSGQITARKQKVDGEDKLFETIRKMQSEFVKVSEHPNLQSEKNMLDRLVTNLEQYLSKRKENSISGYYQKQVNTWAKEATAQRDRLIAEVKIYTGIDNGYRGWSQHASWADAEQESTALNKAWSLCREYQAKLSRREISGYHREQVKQYMAKLEQRQKKLNRESELITKMEEKVKELRNSGYKSLEEESKEQQFLLSLCQNYNKDLESEKITYYSREQVTVRLQSTEQKVKQLQTTVKIFGEFKSNYSNWELVSRWPSIEAEEKSLAKIAAKAKEYNDAIEKYALHNYHKSEAEKWQKGFQYRMTQLENEKKLYQQIKDLDDKIENGSFSGAAEEKKSIETLTKLGKMHAKKSRSKEMSNHFQRNIRQALRRSKSRMGKLNKEDSVFKSVENSYKFWTKGKPWGNKKSELRAISKTLDMAKKYHEYLQMKRISSYQLKKVKNYETELEKRKKELRK